MRLFYALTFSDTTKHRISQYRDMVADNAIRGHFTREANFHLTLEFIGEVNRAQLSALLNILDQLDYCPLAVRTDGLGSFQRKGRELVWLGIKRKPSLVSLQHKLRTLLSGAGFEPEKRKYTPHITLGRSIIMREQLSEVLIHPADLEVYSLALMESKWVAEQLVYEAVAEILPGKI